MATVTLLELAFLRSQLGPPPPRLCGGTGWLHPVGEKVSVAEAREDAPTANTWRNQPLKSRMTVECMLACGPRPRHDAA